MYPFIKDDWWGCGKFVLIFGKRSMNRKKYIYCILQKQRITTVTDGINKNRVHVRLPYLVEKRYVGGNMLVWYQIL